MAPWKVILVMVLVVIPGGSLVLLAAAGLRSLRLMRAGLSGLPAIERAAGRG
jgi:hypothetical protein